MSKSQKFLLYIDVLRQKICNFVDWRNEAKKKKLNPKERIKLTENAYLERW